MRSQCLVLLYFVLFLMMIQCNFVRLKRNSISTATSLEWFTVGRPEYYQFDTHPKHTNSRREISIRDDGPFSKFTYYISRVFVRRSECDVRAGHFVCRWLSVRHAENINIYYSENAWTWMEIKTREAPCSVVCIHKYIFFMRAFGHAPWR